jgi:uncharacterized membrane protein
MSKTFFTQIQQEQIVDAIKTAELNTSGEIRLHIEPACEGDAYERALEVFKSLGMHATELHNGVLIYVAYEAKKLAIVGDKGIHEKVSQQFWDAEKELLVAHFKQGNHAEGLVKAIADVGEKLKVFFPYLKNDTNELSNDISFGGGNSNE